MQLRWQYWICIARRSSAPAPNSVRRPSLPDSELICESDSIRRKTPRLKGGAKSWLAINAVIRVEGIDGKLSAPIRKATAQPQKTALGWRNPPDQAVMGIVFPENGRRLIFFTGT